AAQLALAALLLPAPPGSLNGALRTRFVIAPLRMHWVQTRIVLLVPFAVVMCTRCKLGLNCRREMPVTLVPTPPRYLAFPRMVTWLPKTGTFPQTSHCFAIVHASN